MTFAVFQRGSFSVWWDDGIKWEISRNIHEYPGAIKFRWYIHVLLIKCILGKRNFSHSVEGFHTFHPETLCERASWAFSNLRSISSESSFLENSKKQKVKDIEVFTFTYRILIFHKFSLHHVLIAFKNDCTI